MSAVQVTHVYKVIGNLSLTVDVSLPPNFSKENGILVLHFHGGFLVRFSYAESKGLHTADNKLLGA